MSGPGVDRSTDPVLIRSVGDVTGLGYCWDRTTLLRMCLKSKVDIHGLEVINSTQRSQIRTQNLWLSGWAVALSPLSGQIGMSSPFFYFTVVFLWV